MPKKKNKKLDFSARSESASGFGRSLGASLSLAGLNSDNTDVQVKTNSEEKRSSKETSTAEDILGPLGPKRVLKLGISKKGRGGKTVTTLQVLAHSTEAARERLAKAMGKALGCRVWHEDGLLCLQGEQRERVEKWIKQQA